MLSIFSDSPSWNLGMTIGIVLALACIFTFSILHMKRKGVALKRSVAILLYALMLIGFLVAVLALFMVWDAVTWAQIGTFLTDTLAFIMKSIASIIGSVVTVFVALIIIKVVKLSLDRFAARSGPLQKRRLTISKVSMSLTRYAVAVIAILAILAIWGINVLPALAGLGILGLVVGLGAQKLINDIISGLFIIFERHFDVGDIIEVDGFKGEVIDIGLKTTKIKNWKNEIKIMSNGDVTKLVNYSKDSSTAVVEFGIAYKEDAQKVIDLLNADLPSLKDKFPAILEGPSVVGITKLDSSSVNLMVTALCKNNQQYGVERGLRARIKELLEANGIEIPFPQVVVHMDQENR